MLRDEILLEYFIQEVGRDQLSEGTIGSAVVEHGVLLRHLFESERYLVNTVPDVAGVEMAGTLKNVVALAAGFVDGLGAGVNTKVQLNPFAGALPQKQAYYLLLH